VRIGLNTGEVIAEEQDYFGETVILASRIRDAAQGGQILVSELTKTLVGAHGVRFVDRGQNQLKGWGEHRLFEVDWAEDGG
jgi:class 3 adenylate cyclase